MRGIGVLSLGAAAVAAAAATAAASPASKPRVHVLDEQPFTVRGTGFVPHQRLRVVVSAKQGATRRVTASDHGRFRLVFRLVEAGKCADWAIRVYAGGHVVAHARSPRESCGTMLGP